MQTYAYASAVTQNADLAELFPHCCRDPTPAHATCCPSAATDDSMVSPSRQVGRMLEISDVNENKSIKFEFHRYFVQFLDTEHELGEFKTIRW